MLTKREYKELYLLHHKKAETGDAESQFKLGQYYEHGNGVVRDYKLAEFWYRKAAESKHSLAVFSLNWVRLKALGVKQNEGHLSDIFMDYAIEEWDATVNNAIRSSDDSVQNDKNDSSYNLDFLRIGKPLPLRC